MALDTGTRMFSGRELNAAIAAAVGQDAAAAVFTGTMTAADVASVNINNSGTLASASLAATGDTATATLTATGYIRDSVGNALTAVGTNRATALQLAKQINNVTTAASGTGVILPTVAAAGIGAIVVVFNAGANTIQVYGASSDTIDTVAGSTGVALTNAKRAVFIAVAAATWVSAQLGVVSA